MGAGQSIQNKPFISLHENRTFFTNTIELTRVVTCWSYLIADTTDCNFVNGWDYKERLRSFFRYGDKSDGVCVGDFWGLLQDAVVVSMVSGGVDDFYGVSTLFFDQEGDNSLRYLLISDRLRFLTWFPIYATYLIPLSRIITKNHYPTCPVFTTSLFPPIMIH